MPGTDPLEISIDARDILLAAAILVIGAVVAAHRPVSQEIARHPVEGRVTDTAPHRIAVGISADNGAVDFGSLPTGAMHARRTVNITNNAEQPVTATTRATGNISRYIQVEPVTVSIPAGATEPVTVRMRTTNVTTPGYYTGRLVVKDTQPFWRWLWNR